MCYLFFTYNLTISRTLFYAQIFYDISNMAKLTNYEKHYCRCHQKGTHFRRNKNDASPSKLQQKKMGVSLALYPQENMSQNKTSGDHIQQPVPWCSGYHSRL